MPSMLADKQQAHPRFLMRRSHFVLVPVKYRPTAIRFASKRRQAPHSQRIQTAR
jgi:hypothetical protein